MRTITEIRPIRTDKNHRAALAEIEKPDNAPDGRRIVAQELAELRQQDRIRRIFGRRDPNGSGGLFAKVAYGRKLGLDLLEPWAERVQKALAAAVGATRRVVRVRSRTPSRASSARMV
jgi:hypothetical protein